MVWFIKFPQSPTLVLSIYFVCFYLVSERRHWTLFKVSLTCLSLIYLSICLSIYLSVCLSVCLSIYLSVCLSVCLTVCLSTFSVCLPPCAAFHTATNFTKPILYDAKISLRTWRLWEGNRRNVTTPLRTMQETKSVMGICPGEGGTEGTEYAGCKVT